MKRGNVFFIFWLAVWFGTVRLQAEQFKKCDPSCSISKNTWIPRSFTSSSFHTILLQNQRFYQSNDQGWCRVLLGTSEYSQNFGQKWNSCKNLGAMPFWSGTNIMTVGNHDGDADLDAYQFGLADIKREEKEGKTTLGTIALNPEVRHVGTDIIFYAAQKKEKPSVYFKLEVPVGAMMIDPKLTEPIKAEPDGQFSFHQKTHNPNSTEIAYQFVEYTPPARRYHSLSHAFFGGTTDFYLEGDSGKPIRLRKGRIAAFRQTDIKVADITMSLGYNPIVNDDGILGVGFKASFPTGGTPTADFMLEPIFGRAGAWGAGLEVMGLYKAWFNDGETKYLDILFSGELLHLFPGIKPNFRSFDLKQNGPGSKYLLVQYYQTTYQTRDLLPTIQFTHSYDIQPAVNITTMPVISQFAAEGSLAVMADFHSNNWNVGIGAEFWGRTAEQLEIDIRTALELRLQTLSDFAVLGRQLSSYRINGLNAGGPNGILETFYCEPLATIGKSQKAVVLVGDPSDPAVQNDPSLMIPAVLPKGIEDGRFIKNRIPGNVNDALDIEGARANRVFTGKLFGQMGYMFKEHCYCPTLLVVGGVELSNDHNAISCWSLGLSGSINF